VARPAVKPTEKAPSKPHTDHAPLDAGVRASMAAVTLVLQRTNLMSSGRQGLLRNRRNRRRPPSGAGASCNGECPGLRLTSKGEKARARPHTHTHHGIGDGDGADVAEFAKQERHGARVERSYTVVGGVPIDVPDRRQQWAASSTWRPRSKSTPMAMAHRTDVKLVYARHCTLVCVHAWGAGNSR